MKSAFISSPLSERSLRKALIAALTQRGIDVFQLENMEVGSDWQANVVSSIKRSNVVIAYIGSDGFSPNVMLEIGYAIGSGIPVLLLSDNPSRIPLDLATLPMIVTSKTDPGVVDEIVEHIAQLKPKNHGQPTTFKSAHAHLKAACENSNLLERLSRKELKELVAERFVEMGFDTKLLVEHVETGFDIMLKIPDADSVAVVVKKYITQGFLGTGDVQQVISACLDSNVQCALIITTGEFTVSALAFAASSPITMHLLTLDEFLDENQNSIIKRCSESVANTV